MKRSRRDDSFRTDASDDGLTAFTRAVRDTFGNAPSESAGRAHLAAMTETAQETVHIAAVEPVEAHTVFRTRSLRSAAMAVAAMFAVMSVGTGLAFTGVVVLPEPVRAVLQDVGINVPDGDPDDSETGVAPVTDDPGDDATTDAPTAEDGDADTADDVVDTGGDRDDTENDAGGSEAPDDALDPDRADDAESPDAPDAPDSGSDFGHPDDSSGRDGD